MNKSYKTNTPDFFVAVVVNIMYWIAVFYIMAALLAFIGVNMCGRKCSVPVGLFMIAVAFAGLLSLKKINHIRRRIVVFFRKWARQISTEKFALFVVATSTYLLLIHFPISNIVCGRYCYEEETTFYLLIMIFLAIFFVMGLGYVVKKK